MAVEKDTKPKKWLVTGGCGFVGKNLIKTLLENSEASVIRVFDNLSVGTKDDLQTYCQLEDTNSKKSAAQVHFIGQNNIPVELWVGDIRNADDCLMVCEDMDVVVHLAANTGVGPSVENPRLDMECNVIGTLNMLEGARQKKIKRFIFASSGAPIGEIEPPIHEEVAPHPVSPYGASKLAGEGYCSAYFRAFSVDTVVLRFSNVFGPGSHHKSSVVAKFIRQAINGETLEVYGDGTQTRDFIYIDDLIKAILKSSCLDGIGGEIFQIATSSETSIDELINQLLLIFKKNELKDVPVFYRDRRVGDVLRNYSNTSKAMQKLEWKTDTPLSKGLEITFHHLRRKHCK